MLTNVAGTYLGDPSREPIFRELNRRRARVFLHPTSPACWEHTSPFTPEFAVAMAAEPLEAAGEAPGALTAALRTNTERPFPALAEIAR